MKAFGYVIFINILSAKTNPILTFLTPWFLLDVLCTVPLILSIFFPIIRMVWIPSFLQIWLARNLLNEVVNYVQRNSKNTHSILFYKLLQLLMTFVALVISCIGKFHHIPKFFCSQTGSTSAYGPEVVPLVYRRSSACRTEVIQACFRFDKSLRACWFKYGFVQYVLVCCCYFFDSWLW